MGSILAPVMNALPLQSIGGITSGKVLELLAGPSATSGVRVTQETALGVSAWYASVRVIAESIAVLPLFPFERLEPRGRRQATEHPLYRLLHEAPNPWMTAYQFRETMGGHLCTRGNFFAEIQPDGRGRPIALWPLRPDHMRRPELSQSGELIYSYQLPGGDMVDLPQSRVLHVRGISDDGLWGYAPLTLHRETVGHAIATQEYGARFFSQGARPGGVLQSPTRLTPESSERMAHSWVSAHQGLSNAHRIAVLEEGVEWKSTGMSNEDAEYLDSRKFSVAEIARIFRIPPHMIGDVDRSTSWGTGIEQMTIGFVQFSLMPWLSRIEQQMQKDLLTPAEKSRFYIKHVVTGLLRGDAASRAAFYTALWDRNVFSANDIRDFEDLNPIPEADGGEDYHYPINFAIAGQEVPVTNPGPAVPA